MGQDLEILPTLKGTIPEPVANRSLPLRSAYPEAGRVPANYPMAMFAPANGPGHQPLMLAGSRGLFHHHPVSAGGPTPLGFPQYEGPVGTSSPETCVCQTGPSSDSQGKQGRGLHNDWFW